MTTFHERLRNERDKVGLNQAAFAAVGGVSRSAQINYEKGERVPDAIYLESISKIGCDIQYIILGNPSIAAVTDDEVALLEKFRSADLQLKAAVMAVLDSKIEPDQKNAASPKVTGTNIQYTEKGNISGFMISDGSKKDSDT